MAYIPHTWTSKETITVSKMNHIEQGIANIKEAEGIPAGGTAGQILSKKSIIDYDVEWTDPPEGGGGAEGVTSQEVDQKISTAIDNLVNGAPGTMDTLKELSDAIEEHKEVTDALNAAIGNKVDKTTTVNGKALSGNITLSASDVGAVTIEQVNEAIATAINESWEASY